MKIKYPVSESMHNSVIKDLATQGVKLELYSGDKFLMKTIYIGGETADFLGTYMMIDGSERAYVVHLPGFNGFLSPRFNIDGRKVTSQIWRSRKIFTGTMIDSLRMEFNDEPTKNFFLSTKESLIIYGNNQRQKIDSNSIKNYLTLIKNINCEGYVNDLKSEILFNKQTHACILLLLINECQAKYVSKKMASKKLYSGNPITIRCRSTLWIQWK